MDTKQDTKGQIVSIDGGKETVLFSGDIVIGTADKCVVDGSLIPHNNPVINYIKYTVWEQCIQPFISENDQEPERKQMADKLLNKLIEAATVEIQKLNLKSIEEPETEMNGEQSVSVIEKKYQWFLKNNKNMRTPIEINGCTFIVSLHDPMFYPSPADKGKFTLGLEQDTDLIERDCTGWCDLPVIRDINKGRCNSTKSTEQPMRCELDAGHEGDHKMFFHRW